MGSRRTNIIIVSVILAMLAGSLYVIATKPTKKGLDLSGGTQLIYQGLPSPDNPTVDGEDIDRAIEIIRDRVDALGVSEPEIAPLGEDQVQISLPNVQDTQRAIQQVGDTAKLYFYDLEPNVVPLDPKTTEVTPANLQQQSTTSLYDAVELASKQNTKCGGNCTTTAPEMYLFEKRSRQYVAGPETTNRDLFSTDEAKAVPKDDRKIFTVPQGTIVVQDQVNVDNPDAPPSYFVLKDNPELTGDDIQNPEQNFDQNNQPNVTFDFTDEGRVAFQNITRRIAQRGQESLGAPYAFAIVLDGKIVSRPIIDYNENPDGIDGRTGAQISGSFTLQEAQDLATFLKIGALPVELKLISQSTVTATLGQQALDDGLKAGLIGLLLVSIFFLLYYRFLGVIAIIGLAVYAIFFLAMMKLIPITLTLPGIAGLILTIGVAADSNVVIFERIKEESRKGHSMISSITTGYKRGISTIIDANVITLLTAFVLFGLATAGVKGFAFTLGVGTIVSLLTAVIFTRAVLGLLGRSPILRSPALLGARENARQWHFNFAGASRWFFSISGVILVVSALSFATSQLNFGIDFESGTKINVALAEPTPPSTTSAARSARPGSPSPTRSRSRRPTEPDFGQQRLPDPGHDPARRGRRHPAPAQQGLRLRGRRADRLREPVGRPDVRPADRPQRRLRDRVLAAADRRLRRLPLRAEVRDPGDDRRDPRHPDHRGRLLAGGKGGNERHRRRLPDDPRILALRHDHRVRPNTGERPAPAAGHLLADRQPLALRGADPIPDHGPFDRLPDHRDPDLRRRHPA